MSNILKKIRHEMNYITKYDICEIFILLFSIIPALIYKIYCLVFNKKIWLICEDRFEARDNAFYFFEYINKKQSKRIITYYAISKKSKDYEKVKNVGRVVRFGSIFHWILYFCAKYNISSQKGGKPSAAICYVIENLRIIKDKSIFLQHGITINSQEWLHYKNTKMRLFVCGAKPEYEYVKHNFGYPDDNVKYLGFSRFDNYHHIKIKKNQILFMPTWREWIASKNEYSSQLDGNNKFTDTEYYQKCVELISSKKLIEMLEKRNMILYFYPHRNMQKYLSNFKSLSNRVKVIGSKDAEIKDLLIESAVMITDYSSVAMDFMYMKKPIIYYQFDEEKFRQAQYKSGYFDYRRDGIGPVVKNANEVVEKLDGIIEDDYNISAEYEEQHRKFFELYDEKNSERIFKAIMSISD